MNFIWTYSLPQKVKSIYMFIFILFQTEIYCTILTFLAHYVSIVFGEATFKIFKWKIAITRFNLKIGYMCLCSVQCMHIQCGLNIKTGKVLKGYSQTNGMFENCSVRPISFFSYRPIPIKYRYDNFHIGRYRYR